jgi:ribonuclease HI
MAVIIGLRWVEEVICSDSASVLSSVKKGWSDRGDLFVEMMVLLMGVERMGVVVSFCWVPAHVGLEGNEKADVVAKSAVRRDWRSGPTGQQGISSP